MLCAKPILLVEDDLVDALAIKRAVRDSNAGDTVIHVRSVQEALAFLRSPENNRPTLILLDLNLPGMNGFTLLRIVKSDPCLRDIPIVALTASGESQDIYSSFDLGVAGYMVKSPDYAGLMETIRTIQDYWSLNQLPACSTRRGR